MSNDNTTSDNDNSENLDTERIVMLPNAWGVSRQKHDEETALQRALANFRAEKYDDSEEVKVWTAVLHGEWKIKDYTGEVFAPEITQEREYKIEASKLKKVSEARSDLEVMTQKAMNGEEI